MKAKVLKKQRGQAIVEYIIIIVIVAIAAISVMAIFSDTIREKISGAVSELGGSNASQAQSDAKSSSAQKLKDMKPEGLDESSGN